MAAPSGRPRGHYLADEAGRLAGVSGTTIGQWARRGYIRSSRSTRPPRVYCFQDVAEAMVVHELVARGAGLRAIKAAADRLRAQRDSNWPLQQSRLLVPGAGDGERPSRRRVRTIVVEEDEVHTDLVSGHPVLAALDLETLVAYLGRGGWAAREIPSLRHIEVDPDRLSGRPVIKGKRVPAELAARMAETPQGVDLLMHDYGLTRDEVEDARRWWHAVVRYEQVAA
ncbi:MAG TPA: DUF433 domain-containing protein [Acidimicrobiales bacterium]|nr:DUF433 domain-containing protein [Acidimicrobiales bacterium]